MPEKIRTVILYMQIISEKISDLSALLLSRMYKKCKLSISCSPIEEIKNELWDQKRCCVSTACDTYLKKTITVSL